MGIGPLTDPERRAAVFLDRDGVINEDVFYPETGEWEAPMRVADFTLRPRAIEALSRLEASGYALVLVSNQAAYAKGKIGLDSLIAVDRHLRAILAAAGIGFAEFCYSYTHPQGIVPGFSGPSLERKPGPYLVLVAAARHDLALDRSWFIGDRDTDIQCGQAAGTRTILVANPHAKVGEARPDFRCDGLLEAAALIESLSTARSKA